MTSLQDSMRFFVFLFCFVFWDFWARPPRSDFSVWGYTVSLLLRSSWALGPSLWNHIDLSRSKAGQELWHDGWNTSLWWVGGTNFSVINERCVRGTCVHGRRVSGRGVWGITSWQALDLKPAGGLQDLTCPPSCNKVPPGFRDRYSPGPWLYSSSSFS